MINYSEKKIFSKQEQSLLKKAIFLINSLEGEEYPDLRCHELARAVGQILDLPVEDGFYGMANHSWLWTEKFIKGEFFKLSCPNILDVYCVGSLPQVRLVHTTPYLPHFGYAYRPDSKRDDINEKMVEVLVTRFKSL